MGDGHPGEQRRGRREKNEKPLRGVPGIFLWYFHDSQALPERQVCLHGALGIGRDFKINPGFGKSKKKARGEECVPVILRVVWPHG